MTPQERQLIDDLFDRIARLEASPRDAEAERAIAAGAQRAPHALYALVKTVVVQYEALRKASARIRDLSGATAPSGGGGFLDSMRSALGRGSVPSVSPGGGSNAPDPRWNTGGAMPQSAPQAGQEQPASPFNAAPQGGGGSFLGTAASTAVGVIGGSLLFNALGGMFGGHRSGSAFADAPRDQGATSSNPWGGNDNAAGSDLSRDAGLNDVGGNDRSAGLFDNSGNDTSGDYDVADSGDNDDFGGDFGGGDSSDA